jgi:arsenate reductase-like glutaredoxin family protein
MPHNLLHKSCVRTAIKVDDQPVNQGSGVILCHDGKYYILTAEHCINGEKDEYSSLPCEQIIAEYQHDYTSEFLPIKILRKIQLDKAGDWALLEIEKPDIDCDFMAMLCGDKFLSHEPVHFRGYQAVNNTEPRTWEATIIDIAVNEFKITLRDKSFEQFGEQGSQKAKGLSGSGVYIIRANKVYLLGHLKQVIGEIALNDDIKCCKFKNLQAWLGKELIDMSNISEISLWEKAAEKKITDEDVKKWIGQHDEHFNNLIRKSRVLFSTEEKADENARNRLIHFLNQDYKNNQISDRSTLITDYEATAETFEEKVKEAYTRTVADPGAAKDLLLKLEGDFATHIKDLIGDKSNKVTLELARHKVTWWLMNCSFNFTE